MRKIILLIATCIFAAGDLSAQGSLSPTVLASAGGYATGQNITLSWTLGEVAVTTLTGGDLILTQGFQQPFDIGVGIADREVNWGISVYPNPVGDELRILFEIEQPLDFIIQVQDVTGRLIREEVHDRVNPGDILVLGTADFTPGIYFLKVLTREKEQLRVTSLRKL